LQADQWEAGDLPVQDAAPADEDPALDPPLDVTEAALVSSGTPEPPAGAGDEDEEDVDEDIPLSFIRSTSSVSDYEPEEGDGLDDSDLPQAMRSLAQSRAAQRAEQAEEKKPAERGRYRVEIVKAALAEGAAEEAAGDETTREAADGADQAELAAAADTGDADGTLTDRMADAPPEETRDTSGADVEDLGEAPFTFPDDGDSFVDEEALRELVAEVVREELQGEMGVRITRNIRKLVRREIRLALAAQDLD